MSNDLVDVVSVAHDVETSGRRTGDSSIQFMFQSRLNRKFGILIYIIFFAVVFLRGIIIRTRLRRILTPSRLIPRFKPARYPRHHIQSYTSSKKYGITIPTFSQSLALTSFFALLVFCASFGYGLREGNSSYIPTTILFIRWIANRTGVLSFVMLPLLILTAGRMNLLVWITQWSFDSWNIFHRFIGRMSMLFALIHTICYFVYVLMAGHFFRSFTRLYWNCGVLAMVLFLVLSTLPSVRFIRKLSYEIFLAGHIISTAAGLLALFYHTMWHLANEWLYLTLAFWAIERLSRMLKTTSLLPITATLTDYNSVMRLDLYLDEPMSITPGQFAHLRFPEVRAVESHPFSIAATISLAGHSPSPNKGATTPQEDNAEWTPLMPGSHTDTAVQHVAFLIRPYDGMTKALYELFAKKAAGATSISVKLYFEGPYGHEHHMSKYSAVLFIAGGVGLSFTLPYLLEWNTSAKGKEPRMRFLWIVRSYTEIDSALDILDHVDEGVKSAIEIYYTGSREVVWDGPVAWRERILFGRPCIEDMMTEALIADEEVAGSPSAHLGVFACGPGGMLDQCRADIDTLRAHTRACIDYIEEASTA